jgi:cytochrome c5
MSKLNSTFLLCLLIFPAVSYALSGEAVYKQSCVSCHGANGKGAVPGAPDFTSTNGSLKNSNSVLLEHTINGYQSPGSPMAMPPKGGNSNLTNTDLQNVIVYIRQTFGQKSSMKTNSTKKNATDKIATDKIAVNEVQKKINSAGFPTETKSQLAPQDTEIIARGAKAWATTCSGCHSLRSTNEYSPEQWHTVMQHMRVRARLSGQVTRDILKFLQSSS